MALTYVTVTGCTTGQVSKYSLDDAIQAPGDIADFIAGNILFIYDGECWSFFSDDGSEDGHIAITDANLFSETPATCEECIALSDLFWKLEKCDEPGTTINVKLNTLLNGSDVTENIQAGNFIYRHSDNFCYSYLSDNGIVQGDETDLTGDTALDGLLFLDCESCDTNPEATDEKYLYVTFESCADPDVIIKYRFLKSESGGNYDQGMVDEAINQSRVYNPVSTCIKAISQDEWDQVDTNTYAKVSSAGFFDSYFTSCEECVTGIAPKYMLFINCDTGEELRIKNVAGEDWDPSLSANNSVIYDDQCWYLSASYEEDPLDGQDYNEIAISLFAFYTDCSSCIAILTGKKYFKLISCLDGTTKLHIGVDDAQKIADWGQYVTNGSVVIYNGSCCQVVQTTDQTGINNNFDIASYTEYADCDTCYGNVSRVFKITTCSGETPASSLIFKTTEWAQFLLLIGVSFSNKLDSNKCYEIQELFIDPTNVSTSHLYDDIVQEVFTNCTQCLAGKYSYKTTDCITGAVNYYNATSAVTAQVKSKYPECVSIQPVAFDNSYTDRELSYWDTSYNTCRECLEANYNSYRFVNCVDGSIMNFVSQDSWSAIIGSNKGILYEGECYSVQTVSLNYVEFFALLLVGQIKITDVTQFDSCDKCVNPDLTHRVFSYENCETGETETFKSIDDFTLFTFLKETATSKCWTNIIELTDQYTQVEVDALTEKAGLADHSIVVDCAFCLNPYYKLINCTDSEDIRYFRSDDIRFLDLVNDTPDVIVLMGDDEASANCYTIEITDTPGDTKAWGWDNNLFGQYTTCESCLSSVLNVTIERTDCDIITVKDDGNTSFPIDTPYKLYKIESDKETLIEEGTWERDSADWTQDIQLEDGNYRLQVYVDPQVSTYYTSFEITIYCSLRKCYDALLKKFWCTDKGLPPKTRMLLNDIIALLEIIEDDDPAKILDPTTRMTKYGYTMDQLEAKYKKLLGICSECKTL